MENMNWANVLADAQFSPVLNLMVPESSSAVMKPAVNWDALGPTFLHTDTKKNEYKLDLTGKLDAL